MEVIGMNKWIFMVAAVVSMLLVGGGKVGYAQQPAVISTCTFEQNFNGYCIDFEYPEVVIEDNPQIGQKISAYFCPDAEELEAQYTNIPEGTFVGDTTQRFTVQANNGKYLSIVIQKGIRPHGTTNVFRIPSGLTFDAVTGELLKWQEVIQDKDAEAFSLEGINQEIFKSQAALQVKLPKDYFTGLKKLPDNYYIAANGEIHFLFDSYYLGGGLTDINMHKKAK